MSSTNPENPEKSPHTVDYTFGMLTPPGSNVSVPSLVKADGQPFLWNAKRLVVKKIADTIATVVVTTVDGYQDYEIQWNPEGPRLYEGCLMRPVSGRERATPFDSRAETSGIASSPTLLHLISPNGIEFKTLGVPRSIAGDTSGAFYYTLREEDGFRLMGEVYACNPSDKNQFLAVQNHGAWIMIKDNTPRQLSLHVQIGYTDSLKGPYYLGGEGEILHYTTGSRNELGMCREVRELSLGTKGNITNIQRGKKNNPREYSGQYNGADIVFRFDFGTQNVLCNFFNDHPVFHDLDGSIIWPQALIGRKIDTKTPGVILAGFPGIMLYDVTQGEDSCLSYTDGKRLFHFRKDPEDPTQIARYKKPGSPYDQFPLASDIGAHSGEYWQSFSGQSGTDYVRIATADGEPIILLTGGGERMVSIRHRQEVRTEHAAQLDDGADVVQLYPENSTLVLVPISSGSSSDLRYYGVNGEGHLVYIGGVANTLTGADFSDVRNKLRGNHLSYRIIQGARGESRAFMVGAHTCLPVLDGDHHTLLILSIVQGKRNDRGLTLCGSVTIPPAMIDGEKIVSDADLKNLLQKYPGTERLYIPPAASMNLPRDGDGLCDIMGKLLLASDIDQVPVFHFTGESYYIRRGPRGGIELWNPMNNQSLSIPAIPHNIDTNEGRLFSTRTTGIPETYVYPRDPHLPDTVRLALFLGRDGRPMWSYVWYDPAHNTTSGFRDSEKRILYFHNPHFGSNGVITFVDREEKPYRFDVATQASLPIPEHPGLFSFIREGHTIGYRTSDDMIVQSIDDGSLLRAQIDGKDWYVLEGTGTLAHWMPEKIGSDPVDSQIVHCYDPERRLAVPYIVRQGQYIPAMDYTGMQNSLLLFSRRTMALQRKNGDLENYTLLGVARLPGSTNNSLLIHDILYEVGGYAIASCSTLADMAGEKRGQKDPSSQQCLLYKQGTETYAVVLDAGITASWDRITVGGISYSFDDNSQLLADWLKALAQQHIRVGADVSLVAGGVQDSTARVFGSGGA